MITNCLLQGIKIRYNYKTIKFKLQHKLLLSFVVAADY